MKDGEKLLAWALFSLVSLCGGLVPAQDRSASPPPTTATVYVFRPHRFLEGGGMIRPLIFVNDYLAARMERSTYVRVVVPPGPVVITAASPLMPRDAGPRPDAPWIAPSGCQELDWRKLAGEPTGKLTPCKERLFAMYIRCLPRVSDEYRAGGMILEKTMTPACASQMSGATDALFLLAAATRMQDASANGLHHAQSLKVLPRPFSGYGKLDSEIRFDTEAGKAYYVKWYMPTSFGGKFKILETAEGEEEIRSMKAIGDQSPPSGGAIEDKPPALR